MKIKLIASGSSKWERLIRRWGIAFLIGEDVLFDTFGDPGVFLGNMRAFNIDAAKIKHIVLSHDDWDHTAGLWYLLNGRNDISVYICPGFNQEIKDRLASSGARLIETSGLTLIKDSVFSTGQLTGETEARSIYEQAMVVKTGAGLVVVCGCAHPGIANIVDTVKKEFAENVFLVAGGFHLKDHAEKEIDRVIARLRILGVQKVAPAHCTGSLATELLRKEFKDNYIQIKPGSSIEV